MRFKSIKIISPRKSIIAQHTQWQFYKSLHNHMQSATGCVILGNQDKMPWLTHSILDNMSGSSLSLPQQKYIRTREFGHFPRDKCLFC